MMQEIDLHGVFIPTFGVLALAAFMALAALRRLLHAVGFYRLVWHPPLFNLALYTCLLGALVMLARGVPR
ncbi:DUF1656 domain-containing protein [Roseomonas sp. NAR14]|uniref:DUF1656 domain-containing protein n=1 Tax=Roseomonas acroporae TaxID=2937791 RepID=A0A9X1Y702_9PROT|nr:DUF1656 domain-containing protein [Roseomonas acroporae]MCK8784283.1 DUF1656 domain-containing protein [Roseomonas acroporae]